MAGAGEDGGWGLTIGAGWGGLTEVWREERPRRRKDGGAGLQPRRRPHPSPNLPGGVRGGGRGRELLEVAAGPEPHGWHRRQQSRRPRGSAVPNLTRKGSLQVSELEGTGVEELGCCHDPWGPSHPTRGW